MQSLVLTEGSDEGHEPTDFDLALLALAINDYADDWNHTGVGLTEDETNVAEFSHYSRFNAYPDLKRELLRGDLLLNLTLPLHPSLNTTEQWLAFQSTVFGCPYSEYVERFLGPLAFQAQGWMLQPKDAPPIILKGKWYEGMEGGGPAGERFLGTLSVTADAARAALVQLPAIDGVVRFPAPLLYRTPLLEFRPGELIASSPWLVQHQLYFGFWGQCLARMKELNGQAGVDTWSSSFGQLFEFYCWWLAQEASREPAFRKGEHRFHPEVPGPDEIEDVVLIGERRVALFSCKSSVMLEKDVRAANSREAVVAWLERFFFVEADGNRRGGAFRLLNEKINKIRAGEYEPTIPRRSEVFPILLTYDLLGESLYLTRWLRTRLAKEELLQQERTRPPLVLSVKNFETLVSVAAQGERIFRILELCVRGDAGAATFEHIVRDHVPERLRKHLPVFDSKFDALVQRIKRHFTTH